jgi:hypothetical protein
MRWSENVGGVEVVVDVVAVADLDLEFEGVFIHTEGDEFIFDANSECFRFQEDGGDCGGFRASSPVDRANISSLDTNLFSTNFEGLIVLNTDILKCNFIPVSRDVVLFEEVVDSSHEDVILLEMIFSFFETSTI